MQKDVKIIVKTLNLNSYKIDSATNTISYNGIEIEDNAKKYVKKIFDVVKNWNDNILSNDSIFDGSQYYIKIVINNEPVNYEFKNKFPENFDEFLDIMEDVKNNATKFQFSRYKI